MTTRRDLLARATRMAERTGGEVFVVYVDIGADQSPENKRTRRVIVRGEEVHLSPKEFDLVAYWARHPHKVITHRALLAAVWADTPTARADHLRVFVNHFRKKLEARPPLSIRPLEQLDQDWQEAALRQKTVQCSLHSHRTFG